jgi:hypothetical protein
MMDEVAIYGRALTGDEIKALYDSGNPPDTTLPTVSSAEPVNNAADISVYSPIKISFSELMNKDLAQNAFSINPSVSGAFSWDGNTMTFTPSSRLALSTAYTVTIGTGAKDLAGNSLASPYTFSFTTAAVALDPSLVGLWHFDEVSGNTVIDSSGHGNDGTVYGATLVDSKFGLGKALSFDGVNNYVEIPDKPSLQLSNAFTVMAWNYPRPGSDHGPVVVKGAAGSGPNYHFRILQGGDTNDCYFGPGATAQSGVEYGPNIWDGAYKVPYGGWYHIAFTDDGNTMKEYLNGSYRRSVPAPGPFNVYAGYPVRIGYLWGSNSYGYKLNGIVDEVRIYNRALSDTEIQAIYAEGNIQNTPAGNNVSVEVSGVSVVFSQVASAGNTTITATPEAPAPIPGTLGLLGSFYNISSNATYSGSIEVSFPYNDSGLTPEQEQGIKLQQYDNGNWVDITTSVDTANNIVKGLAPHLSYFAVVKPLDATPPTITITSPSEGLVTKDNVTLSYTVTDDVSATDKITVSPASGTVYSNDGTQTITVIATDEAGNTSSKSVSFTIDKTAPSITITTPADGLVTNQGVSLSYSVSDNVSSPDKITVSPAAETVYSTEGTQTITVIATDEAGNTASKSISFTIDKTAPIVTITFPSEGLVTKDNVTLSYTVTDDVSSLDKITVSPSSGTVYSTEGTQTIMVIATDEAGNTSSKSVSFTIDNTAPAVTITSPQAKTYFNTERTLPIKYTVKDNMDPSPAITNALLDDDYLDLQSNPNIDLTQMALGLHMLTIEATDASGNVGQDTIIFEVQMTPLSSFMIKNLQVSFKPETREHRARSDKITIAGKLDLPSPYTKTDILSDVTVMLEIGNSSGTDTVLANAHKQRWQYKHKKFEVPADTNLDIKRLKIKWAGKEGRLDTFNIEGFMDAENDNSGNVTVTLILPIKAGGDLSGTQTVTCKTSKRSWEYKAK